MRLSDNTVGQEGPTYSPDGTILWMPNATGLTRFPVNADGTLAAATRIAIPTVSGQQALTAGMAYSPDGVDPVRRGQRPEHRRRDRPGHRHDQADLERRHRPAPAEVRRQQALRQQRGRPHGARPVRRPSSPTAPRCPPTRTSARRRPAPSASSTPANPARPSADRGRPAPDRDARRGRRPVRRQHQRRHGLGDRHHDRQGRPDDRDQAVAGSAIGYAPERDHGPTTAICSSPSAARTRSPSTSSGRTRWSR